VAYYSNFSRSCQEIDIRDLANRLSHELRDEAAGLEKPEAFSLAENDANVRIVHRSRTVNMDRFLARITMNAAVEAAM
jgi:hypothetical protein